MSWWSDVHTKFVLQSCRIRKLEERLEKMTVVIDALKAAEADAKAVMQEAVSRIQAAAARITALEAQVATLTAGAADVVEIPTVTAALLADTATLKALVTPPATP